MERKIAQELLRVSDLPGPEGKLPVAGEALSFLAFSVLGFLSALVLRNFARTIIALLLLLAALVLAGALGVSLFHPAVLWQKMAAVLRFLPSLREMLTSVLHTGVPPLPAAGYFLGLFVGLLGIRSFL